jgi:hypothetical protein
MTIHDLLWAIPAVLSGLNAWLSQRSRAEIAELKLSYSETDKQTRQWVDDHFVRKEVLDNVRTLRKVA